MIQITNLTYGYASQREVFRDLGLSITEGHTHGLFGCNGVGKTTLLKLICGLLNPTSGDISIDGYKPHERNVGFLNRIMFLPEEIELPSISLELYAQMTAPYYPNFSKEDFTRFCRMMEIDPRQPFHKMSMGLRKRAYMAFALSCNTPYLIMDEPTNGLDIPSKAAFRRLVAEVQTEERTIIISTHQVKEIESLIDNVIMLDGKGLILNATTEELGQRFTFGRPVSGQTPIFTQQTPTGTFALTENRGEESQPDIELLFNATIDHRDQIINLLKK